MAGGDDRLYVFCDYRNAEAEERRRFGGMDLPASDGICQVLGAGRHWPTSVIIDELAFLLGNAETRDNPVEGDLRELINRLARNNGRWVTLCHYNLEQLNRDGRCRTVRGHRQGRCDRAWLVGHDGRKVDAVLAEISARGQAPEMTAPAESGMLAEHPSTFIMML